MDGKYVTAWVASGVQYYRRPSLIDDLRRLLGEDIVKPGELAVDVAGI
jgi:hypothetical protein